MIKTYITTLFNFTNTTSSALCGIDANSTKLVALNIQYFYSHGGPSLYTALQAGTISVTDISGNIVPTGFACAYANQFYSTDLADWVQALTESTSVTANYNQAVRLYWNLSVQHALMSLIGEDIVTTDFTASMYTGANITRTSTVLRLSGVQALITQGEFSDASATMSALTTDAFYTAPKIVQYAAIVAGADAFKFSL